MTRETITIQEQSVAAVSPEGARAAMPLGEFLHGVAPPRMDTCGLVLPDGVKSVLAARSTVVWVYQDPPRVRSLRWLAADSAKPFGPEAKYRTVRLAMPYVLVLAVFGPGEAGPLRLIHRNECFFMTRPLRSLDDPVCYPALLNCSKFAREQGHPLSWICSVRMNLKETNAVEDTNERMRASFAALLDCLWHTGFNRSSEHHEETSWFSETVRRGVDERIAGVERWEAATREDRHFVLDVPWLPTGRTVRQVAERILAGHRAPRQVAPTAAGLARIIHRYAASHK